MREGEDFQDRANAVTTDVFIVDTSHMDREAIVPLVYDGTTYLMSKLSIDEEENTSDLVFRWTPDQNWWEVCCLEYIFGFIIFSSLYFTKR